MRRLSMVVLAVGLTAAVCGGWPASGQAHPAYSHAAGATGRDAAVEKLNAAAAKLEAQVKAKPKDAKLKLQAADAEYKAGHASMMSPTLDRKVKYREALRAFRRTLTLNPQHRQAAEEKGMIEAIYKQMGRPIPK